VKLTIAAATGGIGHELLRQALGAGHEVTVIVRNPAKITEPVRVVRADLAHADPAELAGALAGADAVLSGLGARTKDDTGVAQRGTLALIEGSRLAGVRRLIVVSAAPLGTVPSPRRPHPPKHDPGDGFLMRYLGTPFARTMFHAHYADLAAMEDEVRDSGLDWTISRPPKLTDKPLSGHYRTAVDRNVRGGVTISRADVAHHMLASVTDPSTIGHAIGVAR
jgi:putative NADH-flavin reductase